MPIYIFSSQYYKKKKKNLNLCHRYKQNTTPFKSFKTSSFISKYLILIVVLDIKNRQFSKFNLYFT